MKCTALFFVKAGPKPTFVNIGETEIEHLIVRETPDLGRYSTEPTASNEQRQRERVHLAWHIQNANQPDPTVFHRQEAARFSTRKW